MKKEGKHIDLRPVKPSDARALLKWENAYGDRLDASEDRYTLSDIQEYIAGQRDVNEDGQLRFIITAVDSDKSIGTVDLFGVDFEKGFCRIGILIAEEEYRGKGLAKEAIEAACAHAFSALKLDEIIAEVRTDNRASQRLFSNCGFYLEEEEKGIMTFALENR